jgi:hypothetical protein
VPRFRALRRSRRQTAADEPRSAQRVTLTASRGSTAGENSIANTLTPDPCRLRAASVRSSCRVRTLSDQLRFTPVSEPRSCDKASQEPGSSAGCPWHVPRTSPRAEAGCVGAARECRLCQSVTSAPGVRCGIAVACRDVAGCVAPTSAVRACERTGVRGAGEGARVRAWAYRALRGVASAEASRARGEDYRGGSKFFQ